VIITSRSTARWGLLLCCSLAAPVLARPLTIIALGDSTTAGTPFLLSPLEQPPQGQGDEQAFYGYWMMKKHADWTVLNFGIDGQRSDEILNRLNDALIKKPNYIVVLAGVNDIYQEADLQSTAHTLATMYRTIQEANSVPVAATVLPFDRATKKQAAQIRELNAWIEKTADRFHIPLADLNKAARSDSNVDRLSGSSDGLHPDIGGYRNMGLTVMHAVEEMETAK